MLKIFLRSLCWLIIGLAPIRDLYAQLIPGTSNPTYQLTNTYLGPPQTITTDVYACSSGCPAYQWQKSTDGATWTDIPDAHGTTYNPGSYLPSVKTYYRMKASSGATTQYATVDTIDVENCTISGPVDCWTGQTATYYYTGGNPSQYTWSVATGQIIGGYQGVGSFVVHWLGPGKQILTLNNNGTIIQEYINVHNSPLNPGSIGQPVQNLEQGSSITLYPYPLDAIGGSCQGNFSYNWQQSTDSVNFSNISGQTSTSLTVSPSVNTYYRRQVTCGSTVAYTDITYVSLFPYFNPGTIAAGNTDSIGWNTIPPPITGTLPTGGLDTQYQYQWEYSGDGVNYNPVPDLGKGLNFQPRSPLATSVFYRRRVTNAFTTRYTNAVEILVKIIKFDPGTISPYTAVVPSGSSPSLTGTAATGGTVASYNYQWQQSLDETNWSNSPGGTTQNYTPSNLTRTTYFRRFVTNGAQSGYSNAASYFNALKIKVSPMGGLTPNAATIPINPYTYPGLTSGMVNYIRTWDIQKPGVTTLSAAKGLTATVDYRQSTIYYDDLGREIQTVSKHATPNNKDLVSAVNYDVLGRMVQQYLPYTDSVATGDFRTDASTRQPYLYNTIYSSQESYYYKNTIYESAPTGRVLKETEAGKSWTGCDIGVRKDYTFNTALDSVKIWSIGNNTTDTPVANGNYSAGTLALVISTDEHENKVMEYKDMEGKLILKKVQLSDTLFNGYYGWLSTYYVYDVFNHLRFVLPPLAVQCARNNNWTLSSTVRNELCFNYNYDAAGKMIIKKAPGAGEVWMVYDARDRLVMTQDSNARHDGYWIITKYDDLNRQDSTGKLVDANNRAYHQNLAYSSTGYPVITGAGYTSYVRTFYDNYAWVPATTPLLNGSFSTKYISNPNYFITSLNTSPQYAQPMIASPVIRGAVAGTATDVLGSTYNLFKVHFYDDHGRMLQTISTNFQSGRDTTTYQYDFTGRPVRKLVTQSDQSGSVKLYTASTKLNYDAMGRLVSTWMRLDNAASDQLIDSMRYDELSRRRVKYLGNYLDSMIYDYNIRGWMNGINRSYVANSAGHYFGMELGYDNAASIAPGNSFQGLQLNGNIAGLVWKSAGDGIPRKYDFSYDNVNRLTNAAFRQNSAGSTWDSARINFSTHNLSYDANGNILSMNQLGFKITGSSLIDQLSYGYVANSNKLNQVTDAANDPTSALGDFHYTGSKTGQDYKYDGNGNLGSDKNKGIASIFYDYLNLPEFIAIPGKGSIQYNYTADGNKIRKIVYDSIARHNIVTIYTEGFVYACTDSMVHNPNVKDTLQFVMHDEGRARWALHHYANGSSAYAWEYDFFEKDHLGNTRVVLTQQKDTAQYLATMEAAYRAKEMALFYNIDSSSYPASAVPGGYPADGTTSPNDSVARVNGSGHKMGPAILLKVMSGDSIAVGVKSFYRSNSSSGPNNSSIPSVLNSLAQGLISLAGPGHGTMADLNNTSSSPVYAALNSFLPANETSTTGKPKAYLNWMLLDNQFNYVSTGGQSGALPVGNSDVLNTLAQGVGIHHSGYLYIWVSNETQNWDVFFDNLSVAYYSGPMVEETHYYPFGLTMAGISDKALKGGYAENKYRFNGGNELQSKEFGDGTGLDAYDATHRMYDPQIGRFWQIDEFGEANTDWSPYVFSNDNPLRFNDPMGLEAEDHQDQEHKHGFTPDDPNVLTAAVVTAKHTQQNLENTYWYYVDNNIPFDNAPKGIRNWLYNWDRTQKFLAEVHAGTRTEGLIIINIASFFIPVGEILQVARLGELVQLFRLRRGLQGIEGTAGILAGYGSDEAVASNLAAIIPKRGWYDVVVHGTRDGLSFAVDGEKWTAEQLYSKMVQDGYTQGTKVRLFSCYSGALEADGAAAQLSKLTGSTVIAPKSWITVADGTGFIPRGQAVIGNGEGWRLFK